MASRTLPVAVALALLTGCASSPIRRFPLRSPLTVDDDTRPWGPAPPVYDSPFVWDGADSMVFRPVSRLLAVDPHGESINVNALDEVPDSSWFQNRLSRGPMSPDEVALGACADDKLDVDGPAGSWVVDQGKANGANPGFRVKMKGGAKYLVKADEKDHPERATGAASIAARIYHAAGYWTDCDAVVYLRKDLLKLLPNLAYADNTGIRRTFGEKELGTILDGAARRGDRYRFVASRWLPGKVLGPFKYEGVRKEDPNDVVAHEDRRELRGQRVLAAWLGHFDAREQNSMTTWMTSDGSGPGHVRHWIIDLNDCFGSEWKWDAMTRRIGSSYYFDGKDVFTDYFTLGIPQRPWDRIQRPIDGEIFGYYESDVFEPEDWKPGYQNPAFLRMSELDAAWMARIIARLGPDHIAKLVEKGEFTEPKHTAYLVRILLARRQKILHRYFSVASPVADLEVRGPSLCGVDLARQTGAFEESAFRYGATVRTGAKLDRTASALVVPETTGRLCVALPRVSGDGYLVVEITNGASRRPLRAHLYDLGPSGHRLVGIER